MGPGSPLPLPPPHPPAPAVPYQLPLRGRLSCPPGHDRGRPQRGRGGRGLPLTALPGARSPWQPRGGLAALRPPCGHNGAVRKPTQGANGFPTGSSPSPRLRRCRLRAPGATRRVPAVPRAATAPQRPSAQRAALHGHRDTRFTASAGNARLHGYGRRGYGLPW